MTTMTDQEITQFVSLFKQFMEQADVEILNYLRREATRKYNEGYYEREAAKLEVTVDYYMQEFLT